MIYCPRCAAQNTESAKFCRSCGTDISLVTEALSLNLPAKTKAKNKKEVTYEQVMSNVFVGVGFLVWFIVGAIFFRAFIPFWFWAIFPGFGCIGSGIGQYMSLKRTEQARLSSAHMTLPPLPLRENDFLLNAPTTQQLAAERAEQTGAPFSVTDGTTRLFDQMSEPVNKQTKN